MRSAFAPRPEPTGARPTSPTPRRGPWRALRGIVACSLLVTLAAALVALIVAIALDVRWSLAFIVARWLFVAALLATPLLHQAAVRLGIGWPMPWALRTPATALLLTIESIAFDILSSHLG